MSKIDTGQTVEEAALDAALFEDYCYNPDLQPYYIEGFKRGAEWQAKQSSWIRVKDQLPPVDEKDISKQSAPVLVQLASKEWFEPQILIYNKYFHVWDSEDGDDYECNISDNDLWMPIPDLGE